MRYGNRGDQPFFVSDKHWMAALRAIAGGAATTAQVILKTGDVHAGERLRGLCSRGFLERRPVGAAFEYFLSKTGEQAVADALRAAS